MLYLITIRTNCIRLIYSKLVGKTFLLAGVHGKNKIYLCACVLNYFLEAMKTN